MQTSKCVWQEELLILQRRMILNFIPKNSRFNQFFIDDLDSTHFIPYNNRGICTACEVRVWIIVDINLEIKWCTRCNNFQRWELGWLWRTAKFRTCNRQAWIEGRKEKDWRKEGKSCIQYTIIWMVPRYIPHRVISPTFCITALRNRCFHGEILLKQEMFVYIFKSCSKISKFYVKKTKYIL